MQQISSEIEYQNYQVEVQLLQSTRVNAKEYHHDLNLKLEAKFPHARRQTDLLSPYAILNQQARYQDPHNLIGSTLEPGVERDTPAAPQWRLCSEGHAPPDDQGSTPLHTAFPISGRDPCSIELEYITLSRSRLSVPADLC